MSTREELAKKQEELRMRALAFEQRDAARRQREQKAQGETVRNNSQMSVERDNRLAAARAEEERRARFREEEEAEIEAERRVQEKKMDQTEALIAAIRAQVEKERAAKAEADKKDEKANNSSSKNNQKPQFRTVSPEEVERLQEKKRMKEAGIQPQPESQKEDVKMTSSVSGGLGGLGSGPSLTDPLGNGPSLTHPNMGRESLLNAGLQGNGLGIDITANLNKGSKTSGAEENTVALDVDVINAALEGSKESAQAGKGNTIIVDNGSDTWGTKEDEINWVESNIEPERVTEKNSGKGDFVDENGDVISVIPVRKKPAELNDVFSAYNIDFDDEDDDDDFMSFTSSVTFENKFKTKTEEQHIHETEGKNDNLEEEKRKAEEEARRKAEEEARRRAEEEAKRKAEEEARRRAEEEARRKAEEEARRKAEEEARRKAEEEARRKAEEEARRKAEEEARRKAEEEARRKAEEEAKRKAEEEARRKAEEEARRKAEEEARRKAEEEARRKAEEEARRKAEEEARRKAEEEARRKAEEEARRKAEEEARRKAEEEARRKAEEEARRKAEEEARRKAEEEARRKAEEEARRRAEREELIKAEEEARRKAEEARRKAEEEAIKYKKLAEEAARQAEEARKALEAVRREAEAEDAKAEKIAEAEVKKEEKAIEITEDKKQNAEFTLPFGAEQYLGKYLSVNAISDQIIQTMRYIIENPSEPRNIVILGQYGFGTTTIAEDFARSFYAMGICSNKTIAKIKAGALNRANISDAIGKLQGGCLVIENAGVISNEKLNEIYQIISSPDNDVIVILTGQIETLSRIFKDNVVISSQFKHLIQVHRITDLDVFAIARNHAEKLGYPCEEDAENMLRRRMREVESGNMDRVLKIVDNAVSKAHNREMTTGEQEHHLISRDFE